MEEAEKKLLRLEKEPYAFSTDNEQSAKAKAAAVEKTFKLKSSSKDKSKLDNIFSQAASELANEPTEIPESKKFKSPKNCTRIIESLTSKTAAQQTETSRLTEITKVKQH
ncbi:uncharacterized protein LOC141533460 [Cotesia typhae]|uniref:uncharacterized protein LOC141533460 n=1 Tax=Cotesia typhae TaxID=2053667 RepID=UPI003D69F141